MTVSLAKPSTAQGAPVSNGGGWVGRRVLYGRRERDWCLHAIVAAPDLAQVTIAEPARSLKQNAALWAALTDISEQLLWHGQRYSEDDWKDYFMHALRKARWMPFEDGGMVPIGMRTSRLSHKDFGDLLTVAHEFGARHGVTFKETGE